MPSSVPYFQAKWRYPQKPPVGSQINGGHPLAKGLRICLLLHNAPAQYLINLVDGNRMDFVQAGGSNSNVGWVSGGTTGSETTEGYAFQTFDDGGLQGTSRARFTVAQAQNLYTPSKAVTAVVRAKGFNSTTFARLFGKMYAAAPNQDWGFVKNNSLADTFWALGRQGQGVGDAILIPMTAGVFATLGGTYDGAKMIAYKDGRVSGTPLSITGAINNAAVEVMMAGDPTSGNLSWIRPIMFAFMWDRALSPEEMLWVFHDPFVFIEPARFSRLFPLTPAPIEYVKGLVTVKCILRDFVKGLCTIGVGTVQRQFVRARVTVKGALRDFLRGRATVVFTRREFVRGLVTAAGQLREYLRGAVSVIAKPRLFVKGLATVKVVQRDFVRGLVTLFGGGRDFVRGRVTAAASARDFVRGMVASRQPTRDFVRGACFVVLPGFTRSTQSVDP